MRDDPVEVLHKIFAELALSKVLQNELMQLVESLYKDLQSSKNTNNNLQQQVLGLLREETFGITSKYTALKGEFASLKQELEALKNENDDLNTQLLLKNEELKKVVAEKEQEMHLQYKNLIKQKDEDVKQKENELQEVKQNYEKKIEKVYAEMEASGAYSAVQLDQVEGNHRKQLGEINKKLKESMDTCSILRNELFNAKEQCNEYKTKILELEQASSYRIPKKLCNNRSNEVSTIESNNMKDKFWNSRLNDSSTSERSNTSLHRKYEPLEVSCKNNLSSNDQLLVGKTPPTYRSTPKFTGETPKKVNKNVPPLMKMNAEKGDKDKQPVKKRKLYNPEDWTYLSIDQGLSSQ